MVRACVSPCMGGKRMDAMHVCVWLYYEKKQLHFGGPLRDLQLSAAAVMCMWCDFPLETRCAWAVFATRVQRRMEDEQHVNCSHRLKMSKEARRSEQNIQSCHRASGRDKKHEIQSIPDQYTEHSQGTDCSYMCCLVWSSF